MTTMKPETLYEIVTKDKGGNWQSDTIGLNEPRSMWVCKADIASLRRGECGPEYAALFQNFNSGRKFRIREVA